MSENEHDPPLRPEPRAIEGIPKARLAALVGADRDKYQLLETRLDEEPIALIQQMRHGHYQYKCKRGHPGVLVLVDGLPVGDRMSLRKVAEAIVTKTGVRLSHETIRRWLEIVFPGEPVTDPEPDPEPVRRAVKAATERHTNVKVPPAAFLAPQDARGSAQQ